MAQWLLACDSNTQVTDKAASPDQAPWHLVQQSDNGSFDVKLSCQQKPYVGEFQQCHLQLTPINGDRQRVDIVIDGGMKAHGHGLPTSPTVNTTDALDIYRIDGLKFSMSGEWVLGFKIRLSDITDQTVFTFQIK